MQILLRQEIDWEMELKEKEVKARSRKDTRGND